MSLLDWRFIKPLLKFVPLNASVSVGDDLTTALEKLQGQINALSYETTQAVLTAPTASISSTEAIVLQSLIPAGFLNVGSTYVVKAFGQYTHQWWTSSTNHLRLRIGNNGDKTDVLAVMLSPISNYYQNTNTAFMVEFYLTVQSTGTNGQAIAVAKLSSNGTGGITRGAGDVLAPSDNYPSSIVVDSTMDNYLSFTAQCGSSINNMVFYYGTIEQTKH